MLTINATGDTTLHTAGKYCEEDILVKVPEAGGIELPELTNEGAASDLLFGKELIDDEGNKITGTFTIDNELNTQDTLIANIMTALEGKAAPPTSPTLQTKTVTPTKNQQNIIPDSDYDGLSSVTVEPIGDEYIIPSGTLNVTANGTHDVKSYASVSVNVPSSGGGGGGGSDETLNQLLTNKTLSNSEITEINVDLCRGWQFITKVDLPNVTTTTSSGYFCYGCTKLEEVNMPKCTTFGNYSFYNNTALKAIDFPSLTAVASNCFRQCTAATSVNLPVCTSIAANAFQKDALIEKMDFPLVGSIAATAFDQCSVLTAVILRKNAVCTLANVSAFNNTPIKTGTGYIYVPSSLVNSYKTATNWSSYANQIRAIEDYPDICG